MIIENPILRKELLIRMRLRSLATAKSGIIVCVLFLLAWIHYEVISNMLMSDSPLRGRDEWEILIKGQATLLFLFAPIAAANAITQEKEQQTWEMLVFTRLTSSEIIFGKLIARLIPSFAFLLLGLPLTVFAWYLARQTSQNEYWHTHFGNLLACYAVLTISTVFFTTIGLFLSWLVKRTLFAVMGAYVVVIGGLLIGTGMVTAACSMFMRDQSNMNWFPPLWVNPAMMMYQAMEPEAPNGFLYLFFGLLIYALLTVLMLLVMHRNFHRQSNTVGG